MNSRRFSISLFLGFALILCLSAAPGLADQAQQMAKPAKAKVIGELSLSDMRAVLGTPMDDTSGVSDFSLGNDGEITVAYQYYDVDKDNYETDFASEIAPRIQALYKKFKTLDRVRFEIVTNSPEGTPLWKPFSTFTMDRKTLEKLHWTWFVARDILDQVLRNKK
jgi:hypothetical protein